MGDPVLASMFNFYRLWPLNLTSDLSPVALIVRPGGRAEQFIGAINHGGGVAVEVGVTESFPKTPGRVIDCWRRGLFRC
ncbi:MAG: hypothetical protein Ct9H300mP19_10420 [Dehalococcoidia bacterium]|nr:MAG: hypothetical protein Ct9H300mP19_10420 [Dehalococcoidia bacterium]